MQDVDAHSWDASKTALPAWSLPKDALETIALATHWPERVTREWAFDGAMGKGVRVCILDSGVDASHRLVGHVESASVGCAMYFSGAARIRARNASRSPELAVGPISIP